MLIMRPNVLVKCLLFMLSTISLGSSQTLIERNSTLEDDVELDENGMIPTERVTTVAPIVPIKKKTIKIKCTFKGRQKSYLAHPSHESACCKNTVSQYSKRWYKGGKYLTSYFDKLRVWNCAEFKEECKNKTYAFTEFARLVYEYNCNETNFENMCKPIVTSIVGQAPSTPWSDTISNLTSSELSVEELVKPCMQVAVYASKSGGYGFYHEVIDVFIPFCQITMCGFDSETIFKREISTWTCLNSTCRANISIAMVVCGLLATAIVLANVTVIFVFCTSPKLRNSQAVYKISLAIADLLVGVIVIPTFISSLLILFKTRTSMGEVNPSMENNSLNTQPHLPGGFFSERFTSGYMGFVGFFTSLSLLVSIYTLMMASLDRFMAIYMPLRYGRHNAKEIAIWASLSLWLIGILFSALPFLIDSLNYSLIASLLIAAAGSDALILYSLAILVPLLVVWVTTLATFVSTKGHARKREMLTVRRSTSNTSRISSMETRLARTLASMVGIFTLCLLPTLLVMITSMFMPSLYTNLPKSFDVYGSSVFVSFELVTALTLMTNSLWNCFIYNARNEDFKSAAKGMYVRVMRALGFNVLWKKTRNFATSTMRSRQTTVTRSFGPVQKQMSAATLRTLSNNDTTTNGNSECVLNGHVSNTMTMEALKTPDTIVNDENSVFFEQGKVDTPDQVNIELTNNNSEDSKKPEDGYENSAFTEDTDNANEQNIYTTVE